MGNILTSGDLHVGHNDLGQLLSVDPTETLDKWTWPYKIHEVGRRDLIQE